VERESNLWLSSADRIRGYRPLSVVFAETVVFIVCVCVFVLFLFLPQLIIAWLPFLKYVPCHPTVPQCLSRAPSSENVNDINPHRQY